MKKKVASFLLVVALLLQIIPVVGMAYPTPYLGAQNGTAKFAAGTPMSVSHRAAWRNGPENSLLAIAASINMGIDVAELDVKVTTDGVAVLMHDGSISRTTVGSGNVEGEIYGAMPTGMESTVKIRLDDYLLTGVVFGSTLFTIGTKVKLGIKDNGVILFDRKSGKRIACGSLELLG